MKVTEVVFTNNFMLNVGVKLGKIMFKIMNYK